MVLGAGPAGSVASHLLARAGVGTLLVDECKNSGFSVGESLPGIARRLLGSLQLQEMLKEVPSIPSSGNRSAWGSDRLETRQSLFDPYGPGAHLDRAAFDHALLAAVRGVGVKVFPGRFTRSKPVARGWQLTIDAQGHSHLIDCGWVMDCTGRRSAFAASIGMKRLTFDKQVAAVVLLARDDRDSDRTIMLEAAAGG